MMKRPLLFSILATILAFASGLRAAEKAPPNFVVIFCDDLGYGDLACFGHPTIQTPNLDRMAVEGQKWTNFYVAACVCTPSRAALITGRYPIRSGMCSDKRRVLFPDSKGGLPDSEVTIAEVLKKKDYATAAIGKWHLGHLPKYLPTNHGFDSYFGIPYSNDMDRVRNAPRGKDSFWEPKVEYWNVPLMRDVKEVERPANQHTITKRYGEEAVKFIKEKAGKQPFFLYLAHNLPHVPLFRSKKFADKSKAGLYGDVIEEIDWTVGQVLGALKKAKVANNTLVCFTSDNGPWLVFKTHGGSAGLLRDGKGSTWEGGMREPTVFWWPGKLKPGVVHDMGSTLDLLPTFASLAGAEAPKDRILDGGDLSPALFGTGESPRKSMFYYHGEQVYAARVGDLKAHYLTKTSYVGQREAEKHDPPLLYHLGHDPSERFDVSAEHPDTLKEIAETVAKHKASVKPVENQLTKR